ncbi:MAG: hydantoinase B/oxoprolinase family protein [Chloroflexi bacterium]|nr:hydantoinase B/oxoprolinase family protein [Chloroflexota bacterium]
MTDTHDRLAVLDDPVSLEIIWSRLVTVADEMQAVLRRTAFSAAVAVANDLGVQIMDARGWSLARSTTSIPIFSLALQTMVPKLFPLFPPETLAPGDVLLTNDPWLATGHLHDVAVVTPFFKGGQLVGFSGAVAHVPDIGGLLNLTLARSVFEEGLFLPPLKLCDRGRWDETVLSIIRRNVRTPEPVMGDLMAMVTANRAAARQTLALMDEYGLDDLGELSDALQTRAERAMRRAIDEIPDGEYPWATTFYELDGPMDLGVVVRVRGSELVVDFVKAPPEHPHGGINSTLNYTTGHTNLALNCILTPEIQSNIGLFRPLGVRAPEGSVLNARYPACVNDRTKTGWHIYEAVHGALAPAIPRKVPAPSGLSSFYRVMGTDDHGVNFGELMIVAGGMGAGRAADGVNGVCYPTAACNTPVELYEKATSVLWIEKELLPDSGGPGQTRGGCGVRATITAPDDLARPRTVSAKLHHQVFAPAGIAEGQAGRAACAHLNGSVLPTAEMAEKLGALALADPSQRVTIETAGGGGCGRATARDPARVFWDVRNGLVSVEAAARDYGVVVDLGRLSARREKRG